MIETQEDLDSLIGTLEGVGLGESPRDRIRRYVERFMETLPEDRRKKPPLWIDRKTETLFRLHQSVAFFHWMKDQGKNAKIMISSLSDGRNSRLHVWYKEGSADFVSRSLYESPRSWSSIFSFKFFDSPEEVTSSDFPYNFMETYDPNFWRK